VPSTSSTVVDDDECCWQRDWLPVATFSKSGVYDSLTGKYPNLRRYPYFLITQGGIGGRKSPCQNKLDSSSRFDTVLACDRRTRDDSIYRAIIPSRGKNRPWSRIETTCRAGSNLTMSQWKPTTTVKINTIGCRGRYSCITHLLHWPLTLIYDLYFNALWLWVMVMNHIRAKNQGRNAYWFTGIWWTDTTDRTTSPGANAVSNEWN